MHEPHKIKAKSTRKLTKGKTPLIPTIQRARYVRVIGRLQGIVNRSNPPLIFQFNHNGTVEELNDKTNKANSLFMFTVMDSKINFAVRPFERYNPGLMPRHKTTTHPKPWNYNKKPAKAKPTPRA